MTSMDRKNRRRQRLTLLRGGKLEPPKPDRRYPAGRFAEGLNVFTRAAIREDAALSKAEVLAGLLAMAASIVIELEQEDGNNPEYASGAAPALDYFISEERKARPQKDGK